jgi:CTP synthase
LAKSALEFFGKDDKGVRMEILELKDHPLHVGVQFHPEYLSHVLQPSRPYLGFVVAAAGYLERISKEIVMAEGHAGLNGLVNRTLSNGYFWVSVFDFQLQIVRERCGIEAGTRQFRLDKAAIG